MRRGIFAPATYGRIRFHSQRTQEYLTARWLHRLLEAGCPRESVYKLLFAERYGIETLVPSLRAAAAWLALSHLDIRDEIIRREPLVLVRHGDPRSLPQQAREKLLLRYGSLSATGEVADEYVDQRAIWLFATQELSDCIHQCWNIICDIGYYRLNLLRIIQEGAIKSCVHLARGIVNDESNADYLRTAALDALDACSDTDGLSKVAKWFKISSSQLSVRLSARLGNVLFPRYLTTRELLDIIDNSPPPGPSSFEGFGPVIFDIWKSCPDTQTRAHLMAGLADLSLAPPFKSWHERISARHYQLARNFTRIAREALLHLRDDEAPIELIRLLMAVERAKQSTGVQQEERPLSSIVSERVLLKRKLFWSDVEEMRLNVRRQDLPITRYSHVQFFVGDCLWKLGPEDMTWLFEDLTKRSKLDDRRIALSAIHDVLRDSGRLEAEIHRLRRLISGTSELNDDLENYLAPLVMSEEAVRFHREERRRQRTQNEKDRKAKASWRKFRKDLQSDPSQLSNPNLIKEWKIGGFRLYDLATWLCSKTKSDIHSAILQWRLLEKVFGQAVAKSFRDGVLMLWRLTPAEKPKRKKGGMVYWKYINILSYSGISLEAAENPDWALRLKTNEVARAAHHGCLSEQGYPGWLDDLIHEHPRTVLPIVGKELQREWLGRRGSYSYFWSYYSQTEGQIDHVQELLIALVTGKKPKNLGVFQNGLRVLLRVNFNTDQQRRVAMTALRRLRAAQVSGDYEFVYKYLAMLFIGDAERGTVELANWVDHAPRVSREARAQSSLAALFGGLGALAVSALDGVSVTSLEVLVRLAYRYVRSEDDKTHEGVFTPATRDGAQRAREALFKALLSRPGADAYYALKSLAANKDFRKFREGMNKLAHGKAEHDAEKPPWKPSEVCVFENTHTAPANTGESLVRVILDVLRDVQSSFYRDDASLQPLLERAADEKEVQKWLAVELNHRSRGRFHAHREAEVARGDKPDIIASSTSAQIEVAIEVKHGGMRWTVKQLERSLSKKLAEDYLKPDTRRHGVLVVSYHGRRTWRDPHTRRTLHFHDVIAHLQALATKIVKNKFGAVEVHVIGIDASRRSRALYC